MYAEFQTLISTVSGDGNALKAIGQGDSTEYGDGRGTNTSGFSALLAGFRSYGGGFYVLSRCALFWSSTEYGSADTFYMTLGCSDGSVDLLLGGSKGYGFSVRCLKD
jgi:uncharacterized protein (TIGR02145 family)